MTIITLITLRIGAKTTTSSVEDPTCTLEETETTEVEMDGTTTRKMVIVSRDNSL